MRPRPGFIAHLRKYGLDRASHRRVVTALKALEALEEPMQSAGVTAHEHQTVLEALKTLAGGFKGAGS